MRAHPVAATALVLALAGVASPVRAGCPPIEVRISGTVTRETDGSPMLIIAKGLGI